MGVFNIDIVVGFMKEQYEYLIDKYDVNLVYNKDYMTKNNLFSLKKVMDKIGNTYILPCDLWCFENPFSSKEWYSWYMLSDREVEESNVRINRKKEIVETKKEEPGNQMFGISYILKKDAEILKENILRLSKEREYSYASVSYTHLDGYSYVKGENQVNGAQALAFARERYAFSEGDRQRGKNQLHVIEGVINKAMSPALLKNYSQTMESLVGSFETNVPYDEMCIRDSSLYGYAEAFPDMKSNHWIEAHIHAYSFFGGVTPVSYTHLVCERNLYN